MSAVVAGMAETEDTRDEVSPEEIGGVGRDEPDVRETWEGVL